MQGPAAVPDPGRVTDDIGIQITAGEQHRIQSLTFAVRDIRAATLALEELGLIGAISTAQVALDSEQLAGLDIRFCQE